MELVNPKKSDNKLVRSGTMAYAVWRVLMKKYTKVRLGLYRYPHHNTIVTPSNKNTKSYDEQSWKQSDEINIINTTGLSTNGLDEISICSTSIDIDCNSTITTATNSITNINRTEVRRSKSRVRSYLKKCKDVLTGGITQQQLQQQQQQQQQQQDDQCPITHHEAVSQNPSTSWYLDETETINKNSNNNGTREDGDLLSVTVIKEIKLAEEEEDVDIIDEKLEHENINETTNNRDETLDAVIENGTVGDLQSSENNCGVETLVDHYLGDLYPDYTTHTRSMLVRQARDLLVCTFHGNLSQFEDEFLSPAAKIISHVKELCLPGSTYSWQNGWPLAVSGSLVLHLGALDESLIRLQDLYICIKPEEKLLPTLCAAWRSHTNGKIIYHPLDPDKQSLSPLAIEMLAEDIPQLLQSLLVGVERAICRIPLDDLVFPSKSGDSGNDSSSSDDNKMSNNNDTTVNDIKSSESPAKRTLECNLKRRELITRNKLISNNNNKYNIKRLTNKSEIDKNLKNDQGSCGGGGETTTASGDTISMPLFCLGGSFPHIDSDEESGDDMKRSETVSRLPHDIVAPRSIQDLPEKLLMSGIYLPGTQDTTGLPIVSIEADKLHDSGVNCYEIATVLLYYSTIPLSPTPFAIHLIINESSQLNILDILDNSLQLVHGHVDFNIIYVSGGFELTDKLTTKEQLPVSGIKVKYLTSTQALIEYITERNILKNCGGNYLHDQIKWKEFFMSLEILQIQCITSGKKLVTVMGDIRTTDSQGVISRRQLHAQHRALSRALMDPELQNLRRKGPSTISRLQEKSKFINSIQQHQQQIVKETKNINSDIDCSNTDNSSSICYKETDFVTIRLNEVLTIFNEVDRAARRLEQLTEQRRERLRELTRQRALEDEMNEVISWLRNDGEESLSRYTEVPLECGDVIRDHEQDFEKFYFISMKHLAKGKDLHEAAIDIESLRDTARILKQHLRSFTDPLETTRERIEGAARLHHLINLQFKEDDVKQEMQKLAEKIGVPALIDRCKENSIKKEILDEVHCTALPISTSTPQKGQIQVNDQQYINPSCICWTGSIDVSKTPLILDQTQIQEKSKAIQEIVEEDEEEHSKMADSGLGGCDRCEGNEKLTRACSCQSFEDATNICDKGNNSDDLEEDFEGNAKPSIQIPFEANSHLHCHASSLHLPDLEDNDGLDQKTQKTLLLIMREMIGTERDYVRSLNYIIENYMHELLREDIPQALRGQRNVIFGNVERIYEFHQQYFLEELERYENHPLKIGAAFLRHESKFYLYALYNKNKPKSDSLMSEYGTSFFKSKQLELNDKMDLASYLLKPVQRMGKYALLLQQLMKACANLQGAAHKEISEDLEELQKAEEMVRFQLRHGNDLLAMDSLRDCDVNVKEQGRLLRQSEFLVWQGRGGKKTLRQVFLFEELVLFSKARRFPDRKNLDIYIYKHSIKTSDIGLTAHTGDSATKFEIWFRKRKPEDTYTLQSMSEDIKNAWTDEISRLLWKQACRNREVRMAEMSSMGIGNKPCLDIRPSQDQINDRSISINQLGKTSKLRNSFAGTLPEIKSSRRPTSVISVGSVSSGTSSSSIGTSTGSNSGQNITLNHHHHINSPANINLELVSETIANSNHINNRKHHRSTTLVSQCSMESGIIADMLMTPDDPSSETTNWTSSLNKSHSTSSADQQPSSSSSSSNNDQYTNNDTITVHL